MSIDYVEDTLERIAGIAEKFAGVELSDVARKRLMEELTWHSRTLEIAFEERKQSGVTVGPEESDGYFSDKLFRLIMLAQMAINPLRRQGRALSGVFAEMQKERFLIRSLLPVG